MQLTHSLKAPGFNPRTLNVISWFQSLLSIVFPELESAWLQPSSLKRDILVSKSLLSKSRLVPLQCGSGKTTSSCSSAWIPPTATSRTPRCASRSTPASSTTSPLTWSARATPCPTQWRTSTVGLYKLNAGGPIASYSAGSQPLNLKCDLLVSTFAFKFNLYRSTTAYSTPALKCRS
jgi:hypothetical protein